MTIDDIISDIIDKEGRKYENVPGDRGGPTKFGITLGRLQTERGPGQTWEDVRDLTEAEAREIYRSAYYLRPGIDKLPDAIQPFVMDWYTTSGTWAIKGLQDILKDMEFDVDVDGVLGPATLDAVNLAYTAMGDDLLRALVVERTHFFGRIVANNAGQGKFLRGWINQRSKTFWRD